MPMNDKMNEMLTKMRDILGEGFVSIRPVSYRLEEEFETGKAVIHCGLVTSDRPGEVLNIDAEGTGLVDACFHGLMDHLAPQFPSLTTISFKEFSVRGLMASREDQAGSDAEAEVTLVVLSSEGYEFTFSARSRSLGRASVEATLEAVAYFVNSEKAFIRIYNLLDHYRSEGRTDLVTKYQLLLGQMVQNTSYTEVIAQIKAKEL